MTEWRDIESAPKDGTEVRLRHYSWEESEEDIIGRYQDGRWICSEIFIDRSGARASIRPTHWAAYTPIPVPGGLTEPLSSKGKSRGGTVKTGIEAQGGISEVSHRIGAR